MNPENYPDQDSLPAVVIGNEYEFYAEMQQAELPEQERMRNYTGQNVTVIAGPLPKDDPETSDLFNVRAANGREFEASVEELNGWDKALGQYFWPDGAYGPDRDQRYLCNEKQGLEREVREKQKTDRRPIAGDPKLFIEKLGYGIDTDDDQPGLWIWTAPSDGCDSSFQSAKEALDGAWNDAVAQTLSISEISCEDWGLMDFAQQRVAITFALSGELPAFSDLSPDTQMEWVARVREVFPDIGPKEAFRYADQDFVENEGVLPKPTVTGIQKERKLTQRTFSDTEERSLTDAQKEYLNANPYVASLQPHSMLLPQEQLYKTMRHGAVTIDRAMELDAINDGLRVHRVKEPEESIAQDNYSDDEDQFIDRHGMSSGLS